MFAQIIPDSVRSPNTSVGSPKDATMEKIQYIRLRGTWKLKKLMKRTKQRTSRTSKMDKFSIIYSRFYVFQI
jgi:hypothetical protein